MSLIRSSKSTKLIIGSLAILVGLLLVISPFGGALDNAGYDLNFLIRGVDNKPQDVVIVAIDEASFQEIGDPWPWRRGIHAKLIDSLFSQGVKTVVLDIILADPSNDIEDQTLANALARAGSVIMATDVEKTTSDAFERIISVQPLAIFQTDNVVKGYAALPISSDSFVRRFGGNSITGERSIAEAAATAFRPNSLRSLEGLAQFGINYVGPAGYIDQVSYYQALEADQYLKPGTLKDKMVFVGLVTHSNVLDPSAPRDSYPIPYTRWAAGQMNGVEIHANAAQSLLNQNQITFISGYWLVAASIFLSGISWWFMYRYPPHRTLIPLALVFFSIAAISYWMFVSWNFYTSWPLILLPSILVYSSSPLVHYFITRRERNFIHKAFASYVSEDVVNQLMDSPELLRLGGTTKTGSVLFLDLEGFTSLSERLSPPVLLKLLNEYLGALSEIAIAEGGMVDKFIGDCIMVVWGTPLSNEQHAIQACRAAIKMQQRIELLGKEHTDSGEKSIHARVGINSGEFIAGNIGGLQKIEYTVLGDAVNLASRLEDINKLYSTAIIISEYTAAELGNQFDVREIDVIRVKGKVQAVGAFELVGFKGDGSADQYPPDEKFQRARENYASGEFSLAANQFEELFDEYPKDTVSQVLFARCRQYAETPPANWQGIFTV